MLEECLEDDTVGQVAALISQPSQPSQLSQLPQTGDGEEESWSDLKTNELSYLQKLMDAFGNDKEKVAEVAGISVRSLYRKLEEIQ